MRSATKDFHSRKVTLMIKQGIGIFTMCLGGMMGDSENLIIPICIILIGAWLVFSNNE